MPNKHDKPTPKRKGVIDVWNAFMTRGATFEDFDIPRCPTTAREIPTRLISWPEAKNLHKVNINQGNRNYKIRAFVHFYVDDKKFDGVKSSIWLFPREALKIIKHYDGIITPDFSISQDFPAPIKLFAIYRMRTFGYWVGTYGIPVINNVRWGTEETWKYCFLGIPKHSIVAIGTVASGLKELRNRPIFERGLDAMLESLKPSAVIVYGSSQYKCIQKLKDKKITIVQFDSKMAQVFKRIKDHE